MEETKGTKHQQNEDQLKELFKGKRILVTGGVGSIGSEIVRQLLKYQPSTIRVLDCNENGLFMLDHELKEHTNIRYLVGDVRDIERMKFAMENINIVFHAAALKHVPLCEYNPFEAIITNTLGTQNVIKAAISRNVDKVIVISTDKATNPVNTMGATKLLAEKLSIAINSSTGKNRTKISCVRFGNVVGSNGSVIHLFKSHISKDKRVKITDPKMTRFVMSIDQAIRHVLTTTKEMQGGEIFILKMPVFNLKDFAEVVIKEYAPLCNIDPQEVGIDIIGLRPGEKLYESLMTEEESESAIETEKMFIVLPHKALGLEIEEEKYCGRPCSLKTYKSCDATLLTKEEIRNLIYDAKLM
jgi:FlaA1/EpsC-like NDP-sugar epimerase